MMADPAILGEHKTLKDAVSAAEWTYIERALRANGLKIQRSAFALGLSGHQALLFILNGRQKENWAALQQSVELGGSPLSEGLGSTHENLESAVGEGRSELPVDGLPSNTRQESQGNSGLETAGEDKTGSPLTA